MLQQYILLVNPLFVTGLLVYMYVTLEHSRHRINPGFHSQSGQSKILKKIPDFLQNAAKQIVLCERTAQKLSFEWSDYCRRNSICQGCQHPKGILYHKEDILLPRKSVFFEELYRHNILLLTDFCLQTCQPHQHQPLRRSLISKLA